MNDALIRELRSLLGLLPDCADESRNIAALLLRLDNTEELKGFYELFLDAVDARFSVRGLIDALDGLKRALETCLFKFDFARDFAERLLSAFASFDNRIRARAVEFGGKPVQNKNVVIYYLSERQAQILKLPDGVSRLQKLGLAGYLAHRAAVKGSVESQRKLWNESNAASSQDSKSFVPVHDKHPQESARAIIKVLLYLNLESLKEDIPTVLSETLVEEGMNTAKNSGKPFESSYADYLKWAKVLFSENDFNRQHLKPPSDYSPYKKPDKSNDEKPRTPQVLSAEKRREYDANFDRIYKEHGRARKKTARDVAEEKTAKNWENFARREIEDGVSPSELSPPSSKPSQVRSMRAGFALRGRAHRVGGWTPPWDKLVLTQEVLGAILARLFDKAKNTDTDSVQRQLLIFVFAQICFGFSAKFLSSARIIREATEEPNPTDETPLLYYAGYFYVKPRKYDGKPLFGTGDSLQDDIYLPGGHILKVPVPPPLKKLIEHHVCASSPETEHLFSSPDSNGKPAPLKIEKMDGLLSYSAEMLREKISLAAIGRSAAIHLTTHGGLDDEFMALIRGYVPQTLGSQGHYINFSSAFLAENYNAAYQLIWERLKLKSRRITEFLQLPSISKFEDFCDSLTASTRHKNHFDSSAVIIRTGSSCVPAVAKLRDYLANLKSLADSFEDEISRFNCSTAYSALTLMALTGMRATEARDLTVKSFYSDNAESSLAVKGKDNRRFDEWRFSFLPFPFGDLLREYQSQAADVLKYCVNHLGAFPDRISIERGDSAFFFVTDSGRVVPLTSKNLKRKLEVEIPESCGGEPFGWKINTMRHLFATTALELGIPRPLIDALTGHTTRGREPLSPYSLLLSDEIKIAGARVSNRGVAMLDLFEI